MRDPFEFFREHLPESQKQNTTIEEERRNTRCITEYPFFTFAPLIAGVLDAIFTLYVWLGLYSGLQSGVLFLSKTLEKYSGGILYLNAFALICGIVGLFLSNKRKFPLAGIIICLLVFTPLAAMYLIFTRPPHN